MRRILIGVAIAIPIVAFVAVASAFFYDESINAEQNGRNVSAAGVDLSGLEHTDAASAMAAYEEDLAAQPVQFTVDDQMVTLMGSDIGLEIDEEAIATAARAQRRTGGFFSDLGGWLGSWFTVAEVAVPIMVDDALLQQVLDDWDRNIIDEPAYEGAVIVVDGVPLAEYPQPGSRIDRPLAAPLIVDGMAVSSVEVIALPLTDLVPVVKDADVDAAVDQARAMVERSVVLTSEDVTGGLVFNPSSLTAALKSEAVVNSAPAVVVFFDSVILAEVVASRLGDFSTSPVDAVFVFDEETKEFTIVPSHPAFVVDVDALGAAVEAATTTGSRGAIPTAAAEEASFTTEMAEAMGPITEVSSFTTRHPCCASRVVNIQLLADEIAGAVVMPGETFSVNDRAGERTLAEGYRRAGAIISGELSCCDSPVNIGGGTSQFATTIYNAVFFGCYEDVEHQPHSLYFSRYPFVREATLGWPKPDVIFRNDSDAIVYIDTTYTGNSITVTFYGNTGGRTCEAERSGNTVTRLIYGEDGSLLQTEEWTWFYRTPKPKATTTTTEAPPEETTTTTAPPETTTTVPEATTTTMPDP